MILKCSDSQSALLIIVLFILIIFLKSKSYIGLKCFVTFFQIYFCVIFVIGNLILNRKEHVTVQS